MRFLAGTGSGFNEYGSETLGGTDPVLAGGVVEAGSTETLVNVDITVLTSVARLAQALVPTLLQYCQL